jgi:hypothetical protein
MSSRARHRVRAVLYRVSELNHELMRIGIMT